MNLPHDLLVSVYDAMGSRADGAGAAGTCRALRDAWYASRHWTASSTEPLVIPMLTPRTAPDVLRMLSRTKWEIPNVVFAAVTISVSEIPVRRMKNLRSLYVLFAHPYHVDAAPLVRALPPTLEHLYVHANTSWSLPNVAFNHPNLKSLSLARRSSTISVPPGLRNLEIIDCTAALSFEKGPRDLETLTIVDAFDHGFMPIIHLDAFPAMKRVRIRNSAIQFRYSGTDDMVHVLSTDEDLEVLGMLPWHALMDYVGGDFVFPEGIHTVHIMPSGKRHYPMHVQGVNMFIVDRRSRYDFFIPDPAHMVVKKIVS